MFDKLFWWSNRKPAPKWMAWWTNMVSGMITGVVIVCGVAVLSQILHWVGFALVGLGVLLVVNAYLWDRHYGYVDAMYERYLQQRERIGRKLGKIKDE